MEKRTLKRCALFYVVLFTISLVACSFSFKFLLSSSGLLVLVVSFWNLQGKSFIYKNSDFGEKI